MPPRCCHTVDMALSLFGPSWRVGLEKSQTNQTGSFYCRIADSIILTKQPGRYQILFMSLRFLRASHQWSTNYHIRLLACQPMFKMPVPLENLPSDYDQAPFTE